MRVKELLIMFIELIIILILAINLGKANSKIKNYEANYEGSEIGETDAEEGSEEAEAQGSSDSDNTNKKIKEEQMKNNIANMETTKNLSGTDYKAGLNFQNARIVTKGGKSTLYVDIINNLGKDKDEVMEFNVCLIDSDRKVISTNKQQLTLIKAGETKTLQIDVSNVNNAEGFCIQ